MRYFIDTEYEWNSSAGLITPISIGIVAEDGREFYGFPYDIIQARPERSWQPFLLEHVLPNLWAVKDCETYPLELLQLRRTVRGFIDDDTPEFWGDYSAFDYVVLSMIMGDFSDWPQHWPMHINDLQQEAIPSMNAVIPHHALSDARAVRDSWNWATARQSVSQL